MFIGREKETMKYITFTIPCYNSQDYMRHIIDNLVAVGEDIEVIIVNDGSKDNTGNIADEYEKKYPTIVKAIQKENGGHGSGVMAGIHNGTGMFFKVVDSDDWVETADVITMINLIKKHIAEGTNIDLYITNYVYEHAADNSQYVMHYRDCLPKDTPFTWAEMKRVKLSTIFLMHSLMYRLDVLKESKMELPSHTFYVDDIYAYIPLPYVKKIFYHDLDLYHYFIGREGQSINFDTMCKRYEQQMRVFEIMFKEFSYKKIKSFPRPLSQYMIKWLMTIAAITFMTIMGTKKDKEIRKKDYKVYWSRIKATDKKLYNKIRHRSLCSFAFNIPGYNLKSFVSRKVYMHYQTKLKLG